MSLKQDLLELCGFDLRESWDLLYRGTLHGFKSSDFHEKCDKIPKTLSIIRSNGGHIFGGYTEVTWDQSGFYKSDKNAFIFSLVNGERTPVKVNIANGKECHAIFCHSTAGPTFGGGHDIFIGNHSSSRNSRANFGYTYSLPNYVYNSRQAQCFLAGDFNFSVEEIEVFKRKS